MVTETKSRGKTSDISKLYCTYLGAVTNLLRNRSDQPTQVSKTKIGNRFKRPFFI